MAGSSSSNNILFVDDFYFSALCDDEELFPISDEKYAQALQFQEALMSSVLYSTTKSESPGVEQEENPSPTKKFKAKEKETGQSSQSFCTICMDGKQTEEMHRNSNCSHSFCADCIGSYIAVKIQESISMVKCPAPKCKGLLELHSCRSIIPKEVFDRWEDAVCESLLLGSQKFYCPFKDCSAMLVDEGEEVVSFSECPNCHRLFCAQCKVAWHAGIECVEFQKLNKDEREREDIMVMELAKKKKWKRCPRCKFYVEKVQGCLHIACRCGFHFCYGCGSLWSEVHSCSLQIQATGLCPYRGLIADVATEYLKNKKIKDRNPNILQVLKNWFLPIFHYKVIIGLKNPFDRVVCLCEFEPEDKLKLLPSAIGRSKRESFSVSKIWLRGKKEKSNASADASRLVVSFRFPMHQSIVAEEDLKAKNGDGGARRSISDIKIGTRENGGNEFCCDEERQSCKNLDSQAKVPSFARQTLLWLTEKQNKVVHLSSASNV